VGWSGWVYIGGGERWTFDIKRKTADRINSGMPHDFVARIRDLENDGNRNPKPGAIDTWIKD